MYAFQINGNQNKGQYNEPDKEAVLTTKYFDRKNNFDWTFNNHLNNSNIRLISAKSQVKSEKEQHYNISSEVMR